MDQPKYLEIRQDYARVYPPGLGAIDEAIEVVTAAIAFCREQKIPRLLANACRLGGIDSPTMFERRRAMEKWAREGKGAVILAQVLPEPWIDPQKTAVIIASTLGLRTERFASEPEATEWLLSQPVP